MSSFVPRVPEPRGTSRKAVVSLALGLASFLLWIFTGLPAVVLGLLALREIYRSSGQLTGKGKAIGGIVSGGVSTLVITPAAIALLVPYVQAYREAARRNEVINSMHEIVLGFHAYYDQNGAFPVHQSR
jgi:Domain of unknown function (DUF4190)